MRTRPPSAALVLFAVLAILAVMACSLPYAAAPTPVVANPTLLAGTATTVPATAAALPTGTATVSLTATSVALPNTATTTSTSQPAVTQPPTVAPTATATATTAATVLGCTDAATFVADLTIPDDTRLAQGTAFIKTWRIKNSGTCTWDSRYALVYVSGSLLGALAGTFPLPANVRPGEQIDLSVSLVAPATAGTYQSNWMLRNPQGTLFGVGRRNSAVWAKIIVGDPSPVNTASISGVAWQDRDGDNAIDTNETLPGVTIRLSSGRECSRSIASTTTDGSGGFSFRDLSAGSYCLFGTDGTVTVSQSSIIVRENQQLQNVVVTWPPLSPDPATIAGVVYEDQNENGRYDGSEPRVPGAEVWLIDGPCHVAQAPLATTVSSADGGYRFTGDFAGSYCVGLPGRDGLDDAAPATVGAGQTVETIHLRVAPASASISGWLWEDRCIVLTDAEGYTVVEGNCIPDAYSGYRADGMIQAEERYLAGVAIKLQSGACTGDNVSAITTALTGPDGQYTFTDLQPGTYCVYMNAAEGSNAALLLPGDWTFPAPGLWYQQVTLQPGAHVAPVNFGWDYQLK